MERAGIGLYHPSDTPYFDVMGTFHIRYGPMWNDIVDTSTFVPDVQAWQDAAGHLADAADARVQPIPGTARCATAKTGACG